MSKILRDPTPIEVQHNGDQPVAFRLNGRPRNTVQRIEERWRVDERWRGGPARDYFLVVTDRGLWAIVYHDLAAERWYLQGIYD